MQAWRGLSEPIRQQAPAYVTAMAPYRAARVLPFTDWDLETTCQSSVKFKYRLALFFLRWESSHRHNERRPTSTPLFGAQSTRRIQNYLELQMVYRTTALVALMALGATTIAFAQSTLPANSTMAPSSSSSTQTPNASMSNSSPSNATPSGTSDKVGQDPKMKTCMTSEKAKNSGLSDDQVKQKCMMQIASHQGQGK